MLDQVIYSQRFANVRQVGVKCLLTTKACCTAGLLVILLEMSSISAFILAFSQHGRLPVNPARSRTSDPDWRGSSLPSLFSFRRFYFASPPNSEPEVSSTLHQVAPRLALALQETPVPNGAQDGSAHQVFTYAVYGIWCMVSSTRCACFATAMPPSVRGYRAPMVGNVPRVRTTRMEASYRSMDHCTSNHDSNTRLTATMSISLRETTSCLPAIDDRVLFLSMALPGVR